MASEFHLRRRIEFSETDMAGIVHFANYFRFFEQVEHAFFRSLGFTIHSRDPDSRIGWPRVHVECDYRGPLYFEDEIDLHLRVLRKSRRSLHYRIDVYRLADGGPVRVASGLVVSACIAFDPETKAMAPTAIPEAIAAAIDEHLGTLPPGADAGSSPTEEA